MRSITLATFALGVGLGANIIAIIKPGSLPTSSLWSGRAAASYLDWRMVWWMDWKPAARAHNTFCISCHTVVPYALARPAIHAVLGESAVPSMTDQRLLQGVTTRVRMWKEDAPDPGGKVAESKVEARGTESVLDALILVSYDAPTGALSPDTRLALDNMWSEQLKTGENRGAWPWLQIHYRPWEGDSQFYGAALTALAVGTAPGNYQSAPEIQDNLRLLREYVARQRESQILLDRVMLLEASTKLPGLLTRAQQRAIIKEALSKQQADGGFSLSSFVGEWKRKDDTPLETRSDGYATGFLALTLQQAGMKRSQTQLKRALAWLMLNQDKSDGRWVAYSMNKQRDLKSDIGRFMSDAATAYAVLALEYRN